MLNRVRSEDGFTLPEMLITIVIALTISLATFSLIEFVMKRSGEIAHRVDTVQRGRTTMDQITRQLRSQVCAWRSDVTPAMAGPRSVNLATPTQVGVYTDFSSEAPVAGVAPPPALRTVTFQTGTLVETVVPGKWVGGLVSFTYGGATTATRPMISSVEQVTPVGSATPTPVFRYFRFNGANPPQPITEIAVGRALTDDELESVAKIAVTFRVLTTTGSKKGSTVFQNEVYVRTADPNAETPMPTCLTS